MTRRPRGVTLIELVVVLVLTAILLGMMTYFALPVLQFTEVSRRAALTDIADAAARRVGRELRLALPNSVRVAADNRTIEFLLVRTGGRYRADVDNPIGACNATSDGSADQSMFVFGSADTCFKSIGHIQNPTTVTTSDFLVVFNLQPGTTNADAYDSGNVTGGNKAKIASAVAVETDRDKIEFESNTFINQSPASRFHIIEGAVAYRCDLAAGELRRYSGYPITAGTVPPALATLQAGTTALVADHVSSCTFTYDPNTVAGSDGLVTLRVSVASQDIHGSAETVNMYYSMHVSNVP
jgi:MSHA biogenesis protein MshO